MNYPPIDSTPANGSWIEQKDKLRQTYPELTDDDFSYWGSDKNKMYQKIGARLSKSIEEVKEIIIRL